MQLSFIIPVNNEAKSVKILASEISTVAAKLKKSYEIIFIDDGSSDETFSQLAKDKKRYQNKLTVIKLRGNWGKSAALSTGFKHAKGEIIFTLDGDLQDNPEDISKFINKLDEGFDLVTGWKKDRKDPPLSKVLPSRILNILVRFLTGIKIHDTNCGFKAFNRKVIENINLYGELYRFIPVLAAKQNFKIAEVVVNHRSRKYGRSKFGWERGIKGILDLVTVIFLTGYIKRPGHFFGSLGIGFFSAGFLIGLYISYLRLTTGSIQDRHPLLFLGMLLMIIGVQLVSTGLLAEMITYWRQKDSTENIIEKTV